MNEKVFKFHFLTSQDLAISFPYETLAVLNKSVAAQWKILKVITAGGISQFSSTPCAHGILSDEENTPSHEQFPQSNGFHSSSLSIKEELSNPKSRHIHIAGLDELCAIRTRAVVNTGKGKDGTDLKKYEVEVTTQSVQIKDLKSQIKQLKKKAKPVISHHNAWIKSVSMKKRLARKKSLKKKLMQEGGRSPKQGRKPTKSEPTVHKDPAFDDFDDIVDDAIDYMETEDAQDEGRTSSKTLELSLSRDTVVLADKARSKRWKFQMKFASSNNDFNTYTQHIYGEDETIAKVLINNEVQNKVKQKGKRKKRSERRLKMKASKRSKRQKTDSDHEEENQLRIFLKIVPKEEKIDYEILGTRARWNINGGIKTFSEMIKQLIGMDPG
ncbi:hypothetical protein Tco_0564071 [Tanacetum coccineum]